MGQLGAATVTEVAATEPEEPAPDRDTGRALPARARAIIAVTVAATVAPVAADLAAGGTRRLFSYPAADAFYYLVVARNWARHGVPSFDGEHATNGFHPLWQVVETVVTWLAEALGVGPFGVLWLVVALQLVVVAVAVVVLGRVVHAAYGSLPRTFAILPFGWYAVAFAPLWVAAGALDERGVNALEGPMPLYGTLWSTVNGMETPLALALFAAVLWVVVRAPVRSSRAAVVFGLAVAAMVLTRLDLVFVAVALLAALLARARARGDAPSVRAVLGAAAVSGGVLAAYLVVNRIYSGAALPTSGAAKSTFPRPGLDNWRDLRLLVGGDAFMPTVRWCRHVPILLPAAVAAAFLATRGRAIWRRACEAEDDVAVDRYGVALAATGAGVLVLSAYDWFFVSIYAQGHWYWPVSILFVTLAVFDWARGWRPRRPVLPPVAVAVALGAACVVGFAALGRPAGYHARYAAFAQHEAGDVRAFLAERDPDGAGLLTVDDGFDAWALDLPAMAGLGLMLDREADEAMARGDLVELAVDRDQDHVTSVIYLRTDGITEDTPSEELRAWLQPAFPGQDLTGLQFRVEYVSDPLPNPVGPPTPFVVVQAEPIDR